jgi:omega-hydroxy-beta-dihydromenaquinone-9 sulfotransferase
MFVAVSQPIFIIGVGRSGSSIFHQIFAHHPQVVWLSNFCDVHPDRPEVNRRLMRALDLPVIGPALASYYDPSECYRFWDHYYRGFSVPCRDLVAEDLTPRTQSRLTHVLATMRTRTRQRHLIKITGWPRIGFLRALFPDALFINVIRDGRSVASSFLNVDWWWGWRGPNQWRWGNLTPEQSQEWERHNRSFVALAGLQWCILMDALEASKSQLSADRLFEIRYEDFCGDPIGLFRQAVEFAQLEWRPGFEAHVKRQQLRNENEKWRKELSVQQQATLENVLASRLVRYGYGSL